jgi:hypothetical protein
MLYDETQFYWATCQAVRSSSNGHDDKAASEAVEDLEMVGLYASTSGLFGGVVASLHTATRATNPAARKSAWSALRTLCVAASFLDENAFLRQSRAAKGCVPTDACEHPPWNQSGATKETVYERE